MKMKRQLSLLVIVALLIGLLPMGNVVVSKAESTENKERELNNPRIDADGVTTWDCVWFGNYWQEDTNGDGKADKNDDKTPIKWRVLSVDGDDAFLLADKNLDVQRYNKKGYPVYVTWETCTIRSWLNGYGAKENIYGKDYSGNGFIDNAFTSKERVAINTTKVVNDDNPVHGIKGGNDTSDQIYLLSIDEVTNLTYGFPLDYNYTETRNAVKTAYVADGGEINKYGMGSAGDFGRWWLRSPGCSSAWASYVETGGDVHHYGFGSDDETEAVRPVLHLNLLSDSGWSYAGAVTSKGRQIETLVENPREFSGKLNNPMTDSYGVTTWDCVYFGNYWQEDTNGDGKADKNDAKQPIKWRVLSVDGDDAFLLADQNLDVQQYNKNHTDVTWETCTMRSWLNGYGAEANKLGEDFSTNNFLDNAFSVTEQSAIQTTNIVNNDNSDYGTEGGNDTSDQVYLLSIDEVTNFSYGFLGSGFSKMREVRTTAFAIRRGTAVSKRNGYWWLRSPGHNSKYASHVSYEGFVFDWGNEVDGGVIDTYNGYNAVRPTLHLNLSSTSSWSYAGTVTSEGEIGTVTPHPGVTLQPGTTEEPSQTDEPLFTWPSEPTATPKSPEAQAAENITAALPDLDGLGSAELKGPELNIVGNRFNLFKTKIGMSLPVFNNTQINIDHKNYTAEVLLGLEGGADASVKADPDDTYWRESYQEVKSLVKACGGKVDTTKLWNRFSKLRGKLKKIDGEAAFKVSGNAAGYIKLELDENDKPVRLVEGGIMAGLEASGKVKTPLWWIVYSEFGVSGSVDGKLTLTTENTKTIQVQGELGLTIKPSIALGADAVVVDVKGGLEGEIGGKVQIPWKSFEECVSAWLTGKLFVKVDTVIPGLKGGYDFDFPRMELYPELGKVEKRSFVMEYERSGSPTRKEVKEIQQYASDAVDGTEQSLVYENAKPEMVQLPDGRILMTYLDDTLQEAKGQAKLMYRLYEDGTWSSGKPVNANTNLDTAGKLCVYGGKAYVLYENSRQPVTEQMTEKEILDSMDLYAASFDASLNCFGTPVRLGEVSGKESSWKYGYDFVADGTSLKEAWAENSGGDVLLNSGNTVFYKSTLSGTEWEEKNEIRSVTGAVQEFCMWEEDGTLRLAYIKDGKLYMDGTLCDNITGKADSVKIFDGQMYLRLDGTLHRWENGSPVSLGTACTTSYRVLDGTVYWTEQDNFKSEIYKKEISVTGRPVAVTADGGYIGGFSLLKQEDGELLLSYTLQSVDDTLGEESPYGLTVLKSKEELSRNQAEVTDLAYDILSFVPGEDNDIAVSVANTGTTELTGVKVTISDADGNVIHEETVSARMKPGEVLEKHLSVRIPKELAEGSIRASVSAGEPFASADQVSETLELETNAADLEITSVDEDTVCITNLSDNPAEEINLEVKDGDETGTLLQSGKIQTLAAGEKKTISVAEAWKSSTVNTQTGDRYLHCEVAQKEDEYTLWNNSIQLQKKGSLPQPSPTSSPAAPVGTPGETMNPGIGPTEIPAAGQTLAPVPTASVTPTEKPDAPPTVTPAVTTKPGIDPTVTATPAAGQTLAPVPTPSVMPTAAPTTAPGAVNPLPQVPLPQMIAPVLQPPVVPSAPAGVGTIASVKLKQKKQAVTVSWKKISGAAGYQVCYSTSKKWKGKKQKLTRSNKLTVKKLKKTYYIRVRAYRINGTGKIYGAWSKTKKITIKK